MRKALGRGLDALLPGGKEKDGAAPAAEKTTERSVHKVPIDAIRPNRLQPRKNFDPERLAELSQSIKEHGLAQPIVVSYDAITNSYELVAGERRLRASKLAGLTHIDAVVRTPVSDKQRFALAVIENIQRDNLNAIEQAHAYRRLVEEFGVTQSELAQYLAKSKSAISNTMRLLDLPEDIQKAVQFEQISEGHARALLMVADPIQRHAIFKKILSQALSVRDVEALARKAEGGRVRTPESFKKSADVKAWEQLLQQSLGTRVDIRTGRDPKKGALVIHFYNLSDFERIIKIIKK